MLRRIWKKLLLFDKMKMVNFTAKLFLSWATKKEVTKQTISRWLTIVLALSGIDTNKFKAHSYRGAGLSAAYAKGVSIEKK